MNTQQTADQVAPEPQYGRDRLRAACHGFTTGDISQWRDQDANCAAVMAERSHHLQAEVFKLQAEIRRYHKSLEDLEAENERLRKALKLAVEQKGHHYQCSAMRGMERDCHCGWLEVKQLAAEGAS